MFWAYIAEQYGQEKIVDFAKNYSSSLWFLALNTASKKVFQGKNFYQLKREWKAYLTEKYSKEKARLESEGLTPLTEIKKIKDGSLFSPTLGRDGKTLLYVIKIILVGPSLGCLIWRQERIKNYLRKSATNIVSPRTEKKSRSAESQNINVGIIILIFTNWIWRPKNPSALPKGKGPSIPIIPPTETKLFM
jgi:hypothetical protein